MKSNMFVITTTQFILFVPFWLKKKNLQSLCLYVANDSRQFPLSYEPVVSRRFPRRSTAPPRVPRGIREKININTSSVIEKNTKNTRSYDYGENSAKRSTFGQGSESERTSLENRGHKTVGPHRPPSRDDTEYYRPCTRVSDSRNRRKPSWAFTPFKVRTVRTKQRYTAVTRSARNSNADLQRETNRRETDGGYSAWTRRSINSPLAQIVFARFCRKRRKIIIPMLPNGDDKPNFVAFSSYTRKARPTSADPVVHTIQKKSVYNSILFE